MHRSLRTAKFLQVMLLAGAVLFGAAAFSSLEREIRAIRSTSTSDPLWIQNQLQFEVLRLENAIWRFRNNSSSLEDLSLRFDIVWSRVGVLKSRDVYESLASLVPRKGVTMQVDAFLSKFDQQLQSLHDADRASTRTILLSMSEDVAELNEILRSDALSIAQARSLQMTNFKDNLLSLSRRISGISLAVLGLIMSLATLSAIELKLSRRTTEEMTKLASEAQESNRIKQEFISVVSHEMRTPLTSIIGGLKLIKIKKANGDSDRLIEIAERNANRLLNFVNDILDMDKLICGKGILNLEKCSLVEIVQEAMEDCRPFADDLGIKFALDVRAGFDIVEAEKSKINQVITNLLSNAAKFSNPGSTVHVVVEEDDGMIKLKVIDRGVGIDLPHQKKIFQPFFQSAPGTVGSHKSSGLGLAISKALIELHGGEIGFSSTSGIGSTFWISLKSCAEQVAESRPRQTVAA